MAGQRISPVQRQVLVEARHAQKLLQRRLAHASGMAKTHVIVHQRQNVLRVIARKPQPPADFLRHLHANLHMPVEADAVGRHAKRGWLSHIVQQRAPCQRGRAGLRKVVQKQQRVDENIAFRVKLRRLLHSLHRGNFRQDFLQQPTLVKQQKRAPSMSFGEHAREFVAHPLSRNHVNLVSQPPDGGKRAWLDRVFEASGKAHRPQHAELVLGEPMLGIANGADNPFFQVFAPAYKVDHFAAHRIEQHAVNGKVASSDILPRILREPNFIRMAPIRIANVAAEGGHLHSMSMSRNAHLPAISLRRDAAGNVSCLQRLRHRHEHNPKLRSHRVRLRKDRHDLLRSSIGGHVKVFRFPPQQQIAYTPPNQVGLKTPLTQGLDDRSSKRFAHTCLGPF